MECPRCRLTMTRTPLQGVDVERCDRCSGLFLDKGELDRVAEPHAGSLEYSTLDAETFRHLDDHGPLTCPGCGKAGMEKAEFVIYTNIILDYCPDCGGFWLDGPELAKINGEVRRLNERPDGPEPGMLWFARFIWSLPH